MEPPPAMRAVDTNIILRLIIDDDPAQSVAAAKLMEEPSFVSFGVLMETAWVLGSTYKQARHNIADALTSIIDIDGVHVIDEVGVRWALDRYRAHGADIADMLHILAAKGSSSFASFEKKLASQAGPNTPLPIERPT